MARKHSFRMRLEEEEYADLLERAERSGRSKADVLRKAMGWAPERKPRKLGPMARSIAKQDPGQADPRTEPGRAAIDALAQQIRNREGMTTPVARRAARERLTKGLA